MAEQKNVSTAATSTETVAAAKVEETKGQKFVRLAKSRMSNILTAIKQMEGLASSTNYDYTQEQWDKIFSAFNKQISELQSLVEAGGKIEANKTGFDF